MPDVSGDWGEVGVYYSVECPKVEDIVATYTDIREIALNWGSYRHPVLGRFTKSIQISEAMLDAHPVLRGPCHLFREDIFEVIAPFLDLDHIGVAVADIGDSAEREAYQRALEENKRARSRKMP